MSVFASSLVAADEALKTKEATHGIVAVTCDVCRSLDQEIVHTPTQELPIQGFAHCDVVGDKPTPITKEFRDRARLIIQPPKPWGSF